MNFSVLSLFDGISAGITALNKCNINPNIYLASEVDKTAIQISKKNWGDKVIHIGDVRNLRYEKNKLYSNNNILYEGKLDLLIGGSPCQSFSFAGKRKGMVTKNNIEITSLSQYLDLKQQNFEFEGQSYLFWEYFRLLNEVKPKYFLLENVKMIKKWESILNNNIGFDPILINSSKLSAQNRERLYWVGKLFNNKYSKINIPQPIDKNILLKDIIEDFNFEDLQLSNIENPKFPILIKNNIKIGLYNLLKNNKEENKNTLLNMVGEAIDIKGNQQIKRIYSINAKSPTLTTMQGGHQEPKIAINNNFYRKLTVKECARLQNFPDNYFNGFKDSPSYKGIGNSWTVDIISHIFHNMNIIYS